MEGIHPGQGEDRALWEADSVGGCDSVAPEPGYGDKSRPAAGYSGYTWFHLPSKDWIPCEPRTEDATLAIRAARIAFSSFAIR